jgi:hypothetical protein
MAKVGNLENRGEMDEDATLTDLLTKLVTLVKDSQAANQL